MNFFDYLVRDVKITITGNSPQYETKNYLIKQAVISCLRYSKLSANLRDSLDHPAGLVNSPGLQVKVERKCLH